MKELKKIKKKLAHLNQIISVSKKPLILVYSNPDPDALASAWALKEIMHSVGVSAAIGYTGEVGRLENEAMISSLKIPASALKEDSLPDTDLIALVDSQPGFFKPFELPRCDIVIDHHPRESYRKYAFCDIRPKCLATSSILTEYLQASGINTGTKLATALHYGIQTDSRNMQRRPTEVDTEAIHFLEKRTNIHLLRCIEFSSYSLGRLDYFSIALIKLRHSHNVLYSHIGTVDYADVCVQIADFLIRVKEAKWALVSGVVGKKLVIVFRCDGHKKHAGKTAHSAFGILGSAGGHKIMGRAEIIDTALPSGHALTNNEQTELFILKSIAKVEK
ncbi:MAG: DHH family phosphoesterase, partial [Thermodesulfobacteriota bacterium]|nr:DHH family phosphoesterase [Thermodesulfobacteriota bacterium]